MLHVRLTSPDARSEETLASFFRSSLGMALEHGSETFSIIHIERTPHTSIVRLVLRPENREGPLLRLMFSE